MKAEREQRPITKQCSFAALSMWFFSTTSASFSRHDRPFALREKLTANLADRSVAAPGGTVFAPIIDDPEMQGTPVIAREELLEIHFRLLDIAPIGQLPPLRESVDMSIHGKRRHPKSLRHHDAGRFMANSGAFI